MKQSSRAVRAFKQRKAISAIHCLTSRVAGSTSSSGILSNRCIASRHVVVRDVGRCGKTEVESPDRETTGRVDRSRRGRKTGRPRRGRAERKSRVAARATASVFRDHDAPTRFSRVRDQARHLARPPCEIRSPPPCGPLFRPLRSELFDAATATAAKTNRERVAGTIGRVHGSDEPHGVDPLKGHLQFR